MDTSTVEIISGKRSVLLHIDGFLYYKHSGVSRRYWNCRNKGECPARAVTTGDGENLVVCKGPDASPHNHAPNLDAVEAEKLVTRMKRKAAEHPEMPLAQIIRSELRETKSGILAEMPDRVNLRKQMSRSRLRTTPSNPVSMEYLEEIPQQYTQTFSGSKFLLFDSLFDDEDAEDSGRILVFATAENLVNLFKCEVWFADGTFKTAPVIFFQLFSILGGVTQIGANRKPQTIGLPFVHALLENKRQTSYSKVFDVILREGRKLGLTSMPKRIMSDFELSIINAAEKAIGSNKVKCCLFHLCQNVYRHIVAEGLQTRYNSEDREVKTGAHMLCALAFVPCDEVERHFLLLREQLPQELQPVVDYFESTYIRRFSAKSRNVNRAMKIVRRSPRYSPSLWNAYDAVLEGSARTNNMSEGWHNRFQVVVGKHHPSLYAFFDELKKEQGDTEIMLRQLQLGQRIRKGQDKKRREKEEHIQTIVGSYHRYLHEDDIRTYLKSIGHHINM